MTYYVHIDNPTIVRTIPASWRNISGLNTLEPEQLLELGWYPWVSTPYPVYDELHSFLQNGTLIQDGVLRREQIPSVDAVATEQINTIKAATGAVILERYPLYSQLNYTARATTLLTIAAQRDLTSEELLEQESINAVWGWINAQRAESNRLEALIEGIRADSNITEDEQRTSIASIVYTAIP
jgi:hypothetical protein